MLPYLLRWPDSVHWSSDEQEFLTICDSLPDEIQENYEIYLQSLEKPWPFYVGLPEYDEDKRLHLGWDTSYDMDGEDITYTCILARDPGFTDVIVQGDYMRVPEMICDVQLEPGEYFIRVQATNESGYTQDCFDYYTHDPTIRGKRYGCKAVTLHEDGTFTEIEN